MINLTTIYYLSNFCKWKINDQRQLVTKLLVTGKFGLQFSNSVPMGKAVTIYLLPKQVFHLFL